MNKSTVAILVLLLLLAGAGFSLFQKRAAQGQNGDFKPKVPRLILSENFQRQADTELMARLRRVETTEIAGSLDGFLVKPLFDDVNTRSLTVDGLEVTEKQFPSLHAIVMDCSRILHITRTPRVFVSERPDLLIAVENFSEPVIVIQSSVLWRYQDEREQRFLIGREFGHIMAGRRIPPRLYSHVLRGIFFPNSASDPLPTLLRRKFCPRCAS